MIICLYRSYFPYDGQNGTRSQNRLSYGYCVYHHFQQYFSYIMAQETGVPGENLRVAVGH
jgi:hypothetical protein